MKTLIVNFLGGPGSSKSTMASHVFAELKWEDFNCELVNEYAKEKVWEKSFTVLNNQRLVYGKQHHMLSRVAENVDIAITDSPLLLSVIYANPGDKELIDLVISDFSKFNNLNIFLSRKKKYFQSGRVQNEEEAKQKDQEILELLNNKKIPFKIFDGARKSVNLIVREVINYYECLKTLEDGEI